MTTLARSLWTGLLNGASTRQKAGAPEPAALGFTDSLPQALYWAGFEIANVIVYGARK